MGIFIGDEANEVTRFSYLEYQAIMLCLAAIICVGLLAIELTMNRFQVLPVLFPGMFSIRERRFYFFDSLVSNCATAGRLRSQAKLLCRMTLCVVLSYLWQHCVMDTGQQVGTDFPAKECQDGKDCFASELHFMTLLHRQYTPVDCKGPRDPFASRVVVSCIRFVPPSASKWLMHLAVSHSVTQLNFKAFEIMVWLAGNSKCLRRLVGFMIFISFAMCLSLFFSGVMSEFASSWLAFVTMLSLPTFLFCVFKCAQVLQELWKEESTRLQHSIEQHLNSAFSDFEPTDEDRATEGASGKRLSVSMRARSLLKLAALPSMLPMRVGRPASLSAYKLGLSKHQPQQAPDTPSTPSLASPADAAGTGLATGISASSVGACTTAAGTPVAGARGGSRGAAEALPAAAGAGLPMGTSTFASGSAPSSSSYEAWDPIVATQQQPSRPLPGGNPAAGRTLGQDSAPGAFSV